MKPFVLFMTLIGLSLILGSCESYFDCKKGRGPTLTEDRDVSAFNRISHLISGDLFITQGNTTSVRIIAQESIIDEITTRVVNGELKIELRNCIRKADRIQVFITTPTINAVDLSGSGDVFSENQWVTDNLSLRLTGSGQMEIDVMADEIESHITGSGDMTLRGSASLQRALISGSGDIHNFGLNSAEAITEIVGSGDIEVLVQESLDVKISGSGTVSFKGNPDNITSTIVGSGNIRNAN